MERKDYYSTNYIMKASIYIPSFKGYIRNNQIQSLIDNLPNREVYLVVLESELWYYSKFNCNIIPLKQQMTIQEKRRYIQDLAGDSFYWMIDDDVKGIVDSVLSNKWRTSKKGNVYRRKDLIPIGEMFDFIESTVPDDFGVVSPIYDNIVWTKESEPLYIKRIDCGQCVLFNGKKLKENDIKFCTENVVEDLDFAFQCLSKNVAVYRTRYFNFRVAIKPSAPGSKGSTIDTTNTTANTVKRFHELYPFIKDFVSENGRLVKCNIRKILKAFSDNIQI